MKDKNKDPILLPESDLLKPKGNPFIWLGLLLVPILFALVGELRRDKSVVEEAVPQVRQVQERGVATGRSDLRNARRGVIER